MKQSQIESKGRPLTIGKLAQEAAVGVDTIRFYERKGLIDPPSRLASGYRQYPVATSKRIHFIRRAQELGFTLREVKELLSLRNNRKASSQVVKSQTEAKIQEIEDKIRDLKRMKQALARISSSCLGKGDTAHCPILESFEWDGKACCDND